MYHASNHRTALKVQYHVWLTNLSAGQPANQPAEQHQMESTECWKRESSKLINERSEMIV